MPRGARAAVVVLAVAVLVVVVTELVGRSLLEAAVRQRLFDGGMSGEVAVSLGEPWRPSLGAALLTGRLDRLDVRFADARLAGIDIAEADYRLTDVQVEASLRSRTVGATALGRGSVRVVLDPRDLGAVLGDEVAVEDGQILVGADRQPATAHIEGDELVVRSESRVELARIRARDPYHLPCTPEVRVEQRQVVLECSGAELPGILRAPLGPAVPSRGGPAPEVQLEPPLTIELDRSEGAEDGG